MAQTVGDHLLERLRSSGRSNPLSEADGVLAAYWS